MLFKSYDNQAIWQYKFVNGMIGKVSQNWVVISCRKLFADQIFDILHWSKLYLILQKINFRVRNIFSAELDSFCLLPEKQINVQT